MIHASETSFWAMTRKPIVLFTIIALLAVAIFTRFYRLDWAPAGGDADVAWMSIEAVDWLNSGAYPYYVDAAHFPAPLVILLISISVLINGVAIETPRLVTAFGSVLIVLMMLPTAWFLLADDKSPQRRLLVGLSAMAAAASSLHAMNVARLGVNTTVLPTFVALSLLTAAYAWQKGGVWRWILAGLCLALTQYIYISAHFMGVVAFLWFAHAALATRQQFMQRWRGWFVMAFTTLLVYLPNLILYLRWSEAFTQRLDTTSVSAEKLIWTHDFSQSGGIFVFILSKFWNTALKVGQAWVTGYLPMSTPVLTPFFFAAWIFGIGMCLWRFRRSAYGWVLLALPTLALADILTSVSLSPNPMRQIALLPFHYLVAGYGLGEILFLIIRHTKPILRTAILIVLALIAFIPTVTGFYRYIAIVVPGHYADPETAWRISQTDLDISERMNDFPEQAYLLPFGEYTRHNIAWLSLDQFRNRHSALDSDGTLNIENLPENIVVIQATDPQRARHTQTVGLTRPHWWVLLYDGQTYFLPPINDAQEADLYTAMDAVDPELLIDASATHIADLYSIETPASLFAVPNYTPLDATLSLENGAPEMQLLGYTVYPSEPIAGEQFEVSLYWQPLQAIGRNYEITVQIWDDNDTSYGNSHGLPYDATYRTRVWRTDEITVTHHILFLSEVMPVGRYHLTVALEQHLANQNLFVVGANAGRDNRWVQASDFRILPPEIDTQDALPAIEEVIVLGDLLQLSGIDMRVDDDQIAPFEQVIVEAHDVLTIGLQWDVLNRPPVDYSYFLHLIPVDQEQPVAQADASLGIAALPSGAWRIGDRWQTLSQIVIPEGIASGSYELWLGVYYYADGTRLAVRVDGEARPDERIRLAQVTVE